MKKLGFLTILFALSVIPPSMVLAQSQCVGDCNMDGDVTIDETVVGVNIGLGSLPLSDCPNLDVDGSKVVTIDEIVDSTFSLITQCGRNVGYCGNGVVNTNLGEQCDNGGICVGGDNQLGECTKTSDCPGGACNPVGADGCAINCTVERLRKANLSTAAGAVVQQATFPITIPLRGFQGFTTGEALDVAVVGPQGEVITRPGDYPVAIKPPDIFYEPVRVTGLVCACVRQIEVPTFGPGNSAVGVIACGAGGIDNISYNLVQDHITNETSDGGAQLPQDPDCTAEFVFPSGLVSEACLEGTDELCSDPDERGQHAPPNFPQTCNSPRNITFFGGNVPAGNALINNSTAIGLLNDAGFCRTDLQPGDSRCPADYGPDCQPCTDDDADLGDPENLPTTTGFASAAVYDAAFQKGRTIDTVDPFVPCATTPDCESGQRCIRQCLNSGEACPNGDECGGGDTCQEPGCSWNGCGTGNFLARCVSSRQGTPFNCAALAADDTPDNGDGDGMSGAALAVTFPALDSRRIGDNVTASILVLQ